VLIAGFVLHAAPKQFDERVVVGVAFSAHGRKAMMLSKELAGVCSEPQRVLEDLGLQNSSRCRGLRSE
jgi:hypothetical protein